MNGTTSDAASSTTEPRDEPQVVVSPSGGSDPRLSVSIELSKAQVQQVVRAAGGGDVFSAMIQHGLANTQGLPASVEAFDASRFSRSLLTGLLLLASFPRDGSYVGNGEIARRLGLNPSTSHRYLATLVEVGLVERDPSTRRYRVPQ